MVEVDSCSGCSSLVEYPGYTPGSSVDVVDESSNSLIEYSRFSPGSCDDVVDEGSDVTLFGAAVV